MKSNQVDAEAFGRVNLIGEHTDYNGGWVLPTAIPQKTKVHVTRRNDQKVVATTTAQTSKLNMNWVTKSVCIRGSIICRAPLFYFAKKD